MAKQLKSWNKGFTKKNHPSVLKISRTFKRRKLDNFKKWRDGMKELGKIRSKYPPFKKSGSLAELIGVVLGDGHIGSFPRSESLTIACNTKNRGFIQRYKNLMEDFFRKQPYEGASRTNRGCTRIRIYQKNISKRMGIPVGDKGNINFRTPNWVLKNKEYLKRYLRGLYEAEGSYCVHKPTYTYKFLFSNRNKSLRRNVFQGLRILGFHPHESSYQVQISKKNEVEKAKNLIKFRQY